MCLESGCNDFDHTKYLVIYALIRYKSLNVISNVQKTSVFYFVKNEGHWTISLATKDWPKLYGVEKLSVGIAEVMHAQKTEVFDHFLQNLIMYSASLSGVMPR